MSFWRQREVKVSDEIVNEIVSYLPGAQFWFPDVPAPRAFGGPNPRNYLHLHSAAQVNKQWKRVTEPFLYKDVVLIGDRQSRLLAYTLSTKKWKNAHLGKLIKNLRVEAGYSVRALGYILLVSPRIQQLYIEFPAEDQGNLNHLSEGLEGINPRRLALYDPIGPRWQRVDRGLFKEIAKRLSLWNNLTEVQLDLKNCEYSSNDNDFLCRILSRSRHLRKVVWATRSRSDDHGIHPKDLLTLSSSEYIEAIQVIIEPRMDPDDSWGARRIMEYPELRRRVEFIDPIDALWKC